MNKKAKKTEVISVRFPEDEYNRLQEFCNSTDLTLAQIVRRAIRLYLDLEHDQDL